MNRKALRKTQCILLRACQWGERYTFVCRFLWLAVSAHVYIPSKSRVLFRTELAWNIVPMMATSDRGPGNYLLPKSIFTWPGLSLLLILLFGFLSRKEAHLSQSVVLVFGARLGTRLYNTSISESANAHFLKISRGRGGIPVSKVLAQPWNRFWNGSGNNDTTNSSKWRM